MKTAGSWVRVWRWSYKFNYACFWDTCIIRSPKGEENLTNVWREHLKWILKVNIAYVLFIKNHHSNMVEYHVPVAPGGVASIFGLLESNKAVLQIKHFSVRQTTLDEVRYIRCFWSLFIYPHAVVLWNTKGDLFVWRIFTQLFSITLQFVVICQVLTDT